MAEPGKTGPVESGPVKSEQGKPEQGKPEQGKPAHSPKGRSKSASHFPQGYAPRFIAIEAIFRARKERRPLDETMSLVKADALSPADFALARAIALTTFRRFATLEALVAARLDAGALPVVPMLAEALYAGAAQMLFMHVPDHAAVDCTVAFCKTQPKCLPYAKLVNALLRRIGADKSALLAQLAPQADLPDWMRARWQRFYGAKAASEMAEALLWPVCVDLTPLHGTPEALAQAVEGVRLPTGSVRLAHARAVADLPGYAEGVFQVQDVASALPARLLGAKPGMAVLDLCSAPGGKAAQLAAAGAKVVAVERSAARAVRLRENFARLNLAVDLHIAAAETFTQGLFEAVLLDAPCSATGTLRRHPEIAWSRTLADVLALAERQAVLLAAAAARVKPGGVLVYATCSLEAEEGEAQIARFLAQNPRFSRVSLVAEALGVPPECVNAQGELRVLPQHFASFGGADGFFAARLCCEQKYT